RNSSATSPGRGTPGMAMIRTTAHRMRSQVIMTPRRGYLSASQARVTPPPARTLVPQPGQGDAPDERRHDAAHEGDRGEQGRTRPVVDQHGQGYSGELITNHRQKLR